MVHVLQFKHFKVKRTLINYIIIANKGHYYCFYVTEYKLQCLQHQSQIQYIIQCTSDLSLILSTCNITSWLFLYSTLELLCTVKLTDLFIFYICEVKLFASIYYNSIYFPVQFPVLTFSADVPFRKMCYKILLHIVSFVGFVEN